MKRLAFDRKGARNWGLERREEGEISPFVQMRKTQEIQQLQVSEVQV